MSYHQQTESISCSQLKLFCASPRRYYETYITKRLQPQIASSAMDTGSVLHAHFLTGKPLEELVTKLPREFYTEGKNRKKPKLNGQKKDEREDWILNARLSGQYVLTELEYNQAINARNAHLEGELGDLLKVGGTYEQENYWDESIQGHSIPCRSRVDWFVVNENEVIAYDLKCVENVEQFERTSRKFQYWLQDAHYSAGLKHDYELPVTFRFVVIETQFPYRTRIVCYDEASRETAIDYHKTKLLDFWRRMKSTKSNGVAAWEDNFSSVLVLSPWDVDDSESELVGAEVADGE